MIPYQLEILEQLPVTGRVAVRAPHGAGKTALAAWVILWGVLTSDDCKVATTAGSWHQLTHFLWPEVHKWVAKLKWEQIGRPPLDRYELLTRSIKRGAICEAFAVASDRPELIEGAHAWRIIYVYDESKAIMDATFDASEGAFAQAGPDTGFEAYALAISTPGEPQGRFFDIFQRKPGLESWWPRHIKMEECIEAGMMSLEWVEEKKKLWTPVSAIYQNRVLGEFATSGTDGVIPLAWIERAVERWHEWQEAGGGGEWTGVGVDVGGGEGGDASTIAPCYDGCKIDTLRVFLHDDPNTATMQLAGRVKGILDARGGIAVVDSIGIGAGMLHRLNEQGLEDEVWGFNAGESTKHKDVSNERGFVNKRSAGWWIMREMLDPSNEYDVCLPPDPQGRLIGELAAPKYREMSGGRIKVESKNEVKKRLSGRSTDYADAVMHILARQLVEPRSPFLGFI